VIEPKLSSCGLAAPLYYSEVSACQHACTSLTCRGLARLATSAALTTGECEESAKLDETSESSDIEKETVEPNRRLNRAAHSHPNSLDSKHQPKIDSNQPSWSLRNQKQPDTRVVPHPGTPLDKPPWKHESLAAACPGLLQRPRFPCSAATVTQHI
jgi:hypothetical protein